MKEVKNERRRKINTYQKKGKEKERYVKSEKETERENLRDGLEWNEDKIDVVFFYKIEHVSFYAGLLCTRRK